MPYKLQSRICTLPTAVTPHCTHYILLQLPTMYKSWKVKTFSNPRVQQSCKRLVARIITNIYICTRVPVFDSLLLQLANSCIFRSDFVCAHVIWCHIVSHSSPHLVSLWVLPCSAPNIMVQSGNHILPIYNGPTCGCKELCFKSYNCNQQFQGISYFSYLLFFEIFLVLITCKCLLLQCFLSFSLISERP